MKYVSEGRGEKKTHSALSKKSQKDAASDAQVHLKNARTVTHEMGEQEKDRPSEC